mgnify:CR=1 FL=1
MTLHLIVPWSGREKPVNILIVVVLPAPLCPNKLYPS